MKMDTDIIKASIDHYGKTVQSVVCMEECCELAQAISKEMRGKPDKQHLTEEMADVLICIEMLKQMYGISNDDIERWVAIKQYRTVKRIEDEGYEIIRKIDGGGEI
uniref:Nucleoside triphosphate pyrophosphohydrolase n=1 Tax=Myoviridae sp. ctBbR2 TaxID=2827667 RepID=A0A8S5SFT8_9CAUD|nr:MAG TPA: nucleoside triphosphate pyrophosphohydrolase [Myoviridae sp. ctBbR2]